MNKHNTTAIQNDDLVTLKMPADEFSVTRDITVQAIGISRTIVQLFIT